jgi:hypothetical protein
MSKSYAMAFCYKLNHAFFLCGTCHIFQDRVICGSDYPFPLGEHHPGKLIQESDFPEEIKVSVNI